MKKCGYELTQNMESKKTASTKRSQEKLDPPLSFLFLLQILPFIIFKSVYYITILEIY